MTATDPTMVTGAPCGPGSAADLIARDTEISLRQANSSPAQLALKDGRSIWVEDLDGRRYIDLYGNNCHHLGHAHPKVIAAIKDQLLRTTFVSRGHTAEPAIALSEAIADRHPLDRPKVMLTTGGSSAVETALMVAKAHTERFKTISMYDSYHGRSAGAVSVGGRYRDRSPQMGPLMPGAMHVPAYYAHDHARGVTGRLVASDDSAERSLETIRQVFDYERDIAAFIAEPLRAGPTGPACAPKWFWQEVRTLCDSFGAALIFDEVPGGLGKTGHLFNSESVGTIPDMTVLGKSLGGGILPIAAVVVDRRFDTIAQLNLGYYTHEKNPVTASAGMAAFRILSDPNTLAHVRTQSEHISAALQHLATGSKMISGTRHFGFLFALDLVGGVSRLPTSQAKALRATIMQHGIIPMPAVSNCLTFSAPLITSPDEFARIFSLLEAALRDAGSSQTGNNP